MGWFGDKILDTIFHKVKENIDAKKLQIDIENAVKDILQHYEDEVFYNEFINFIKSSGKVKQLINVYFEIDANVAKTEEDTATIICDDFFEFANNISVSL